MHLWFENNESTDSSRSYSDIPSDSLDDIFDEFRNASSRNQSKGPVEVFDSSEIAPDTPSDSEEGDNDLNDYDSFVCK